MTMRPRDAVDAPEPAPGVPEGAGAQPRERDDFGAGSIEPMLALSSSDGESRGPGPATTIDPLIRAVARVEAAPGLAPGQVFDGNYELMERIGGGGMGIIFRARDHRLGRDVAVKVLRPSESGAAVHVRRLFEREARATAQLLHPNIVTLHHVGEHSKHPYLVLELLKGETLAARLARRGRLPVLEALAIIDDVLCALEFAHERGVLHRDLKPNNVFITVDDRVKVLDFGVALTLDTDPGPMTRAAGTPGYMAPEHRSGGVQDARTDVWSAALLLLECLAGRRLDARAAISALAALDLKRSLHDVLARALDTDPARRPESAGQLRSMLAPVRRPLIAAGDGSRRRRIGWAAALVAAGAIGGAAAAYALVPQRAEPIAAAERPLELGPPPTAAEVSGLYATNHGGMLFKVDSDGNAYGVYNHDDGIIVGYYHDGLFLGRWCELPTRRSSDDSGEMEIRFERSAWRIQQGGRWNYGTGAWQMDWRGWSISTDPPPGLIKRLEQATRCP